MTSDPVKDKKELTEHQHEKQKEMTHEERAAQMSSREAMKQTRENPEMLERLRDPDVKDKKVYEELGPAASGSHVTAQREKGWAKHQKWHNMAAAERVKTEFRPGRLAMVGDSPANDESDGGLVRRVMHDVYAHGSSDDKPRAKLSPRQERRLRDGYDALTSQQSGGEGGTVLERLTEIIAVSKTETDEEEESSGVLSRVGGFYK